MLDVLATGYPSLDHILATSRSPAIGETALLTVPIGEAPATFGGCGANVAVGLQRLGAQAGLAMVLGDDQGGRHYHDYLYQEGVDVRNVVCLPGHKTSRSYLFRNPEGEYQNFFFPGAADAWNDQLTLQDLPSVRYGLITVGAHHYNRQFARCLSDHNIPIIWQLKADIAAYPDEALHLLVRSCCIMFFNQLEAAYLCRALHIADVRLLLDRVDVLVLTQGRQGSTLITRDGQTPIPAVARTVIDTTGAGDGFTAGFLAGFLKRLDLLTCGRLGAVAASFVLEKIGCQTNLPTWDQLWQRYRETFGEP